jgi:hypothetical protein
MPFYNSLLFILLYTFYAAKSTSVHVLLTLVSISVHETEDPVFISDQEPVPPTFTSDQAVMLIEPILSNNPVPVTFTLAFAVV